MLALNTSIFAVDVGWRLCFGLGAVLGLVILLVRRNVPESPRWLFIHRREDEAERIVSEIERGVEGSTGRELSEPDEAITVRQRRVVPLTMIVRSVATLYPKRTALGLALFVGQAFLYNSILFGLGDLLGTYFGVFSGDIPYYTAIFAGGNLFGPLLLGRLFDTVGRKPMIAGTYVLSGALLALTAVLFAGHQLTTTTMILALTVVFFFASAGVSGAYLTVCEVFPMETRAMCISVFYAIGTGVGGITGPLLFSALISTGTYAKAELALLLGAAVMTIGGLAEAVFGVKAEGQSLEDIARPLTAEEAGDEDGDGGGPRPTAAPAAA